MSGFPQWKASWVDPGRAEGAHEGDGESAWEGNMRQIVVVLMLLLPAASAVAQDPKAPDTVSEKCRFGAFVVKYIVIRDQGAIMLGGRGGWNVTSSLLLGGGMYGTLNGVDAREDAVPDAPGRLDVKFESFGFDLEYAVRPAAPTHLTLTAFLGGAADRYVRHKTDQQHGETDFMTLFEPALGVERRITGWLHLNLGVSYRLTSEVEQQGLEDGDFNGTAVALAVDLGRF
jgi:hypothetical protein